MCGDACVPSRSLCVTIPAVYVHMCHMPVQACICPSTSTCLWPACGIPVATRAEYAKCMPKYRVYPCMPMRAHTRVCRVYPVCPRVCVSVCVYAIGSPCSRRTAYALALRGARRAPGAVGAVRVPRRGAGERGEAGGGARRRGREAVPAPTDLQTFINSAAPAAAAGLVEHRH